MQPYEIRCRNCKKKLLTYSGSSYPKYKSPVKKCKKCGTVYADPRCHEIAIEGIPRGMFSVPAYAVMLVIGALMCWRGIYLFGVRQLSVPDAVQWLLPALFTVSGAVMAIAAVAGIIAIRTGVKEKRFDRLRRESEARLGDKNYAYLLRDLGYQVPEKYL